jgi:hypothetical protein
VFVDVRLPIDPDLDLDSFEFADMGWDDQLVDVPEGTQSWSQRLGPFPEYDGLLVDVTAELDHDSREARWTFTAIDPDTGDTPIDERGFLFPEDGSGNGQGFARYFVDAAADRPNGTMLTAQATIVFDDQEPLATNVWSNAIDIDTPTARVDALPAQTAGRDVTVRWTGTDAGSGVESVDVFVSVNGGPLTVWREQVTRPVVFTGRVGRRYGFSVRAHDYVGHVAPAPRSVQAATALVADGGDDGPPAGLLALDRDGRVYKGDGASLHGSPAGNLDAVAIARTPTGRGYAMLDRSGKVQHFGDSRRLGSPTLRSDRAVDIDITPTGRGYVIATARGRVFAFGDARGHGGPGGLRSSVVAIELSASGRGYLIATAKGRVFAFGDAAGHGSAPRAASPVVDLETIRGGRGYYLVRADGTVHHFGQAPAIENRRRRRPVAGIVATPRQKGVWIVYTDGLVRHYRHGRPLRRVTGRLTAPLVAVD